MSTEPEPAMIDTYTMCSRLFDSLWRTKRTIRSALGVWSCATWCGVSAVRYADDENVSYIVMHRWSHDKGSYVTLFLTDPEDMASTKSVDLARSYRSLPDLIQGVINAAAQLSGAVADAD